VKNSKTQELKNSRTQEFFTVLLTLSTPLKNGWEIFTNFATKKCYKGYGWANNCKYFIKGTTALTD
jgi:hypothetical protein